MTPKPTDLGDSLSASIRHVHFKWASDCPALDSLAAQANMGQQAL